MISVRKINIGLTVLMLALGVSAFANAQQASGMPQGQSPFASPMNGAGADNGGWNADNVNRKDLREEMEQIRKQHEELEASREQLRAKCGGIQGPPSPGAPGQGAAPPPPPQMTPECEQQRQEMRTQFEEFHQRRQALREKMEAWRASHPGTGQNFGMGGQGPGASLGGVPNSSGRQPPMPSSPPPAPPPNGSQGSGSVPSFGPAPDR